MPPPVNNPDLVVGSGPDEIDPHVSEDAYQGDAQFTVSVDGAQVGGVLTATAPQQYSESQLLRVLGNFGPGPHSVTVDFLNDLYGGSPSADRNLYVGPVTYGDEVSPGAALYSGGPHVFQVQGPAVVTDTASLNAAIDAADAAASITGGTLPTSVNLHLTITLANDITETGALDAINLQPGVSLTIDGQGHTLDGAGTYRGLFAYAGLTTVQNLAIDDTVARGGNGGFVSGGGGAGLGGGLFVAGTNAGLASGAVVTLNNVTFSSDKAVGGNGSSGYPYLGALGPGPGGGGGGGVGGNGGNDQSVGGTGGGGGVGGDGGTAAAGAPGIVPGAAGGGNGASGAFPGSTAYPGGANGGGGGGTSVNSFGAGGGGGVGGANAGLVSNNGSYTGGIGGFGGGGASGQNGGFGGGGGGDGGKGGFGGGGGGVVSGTGASGGFGAGNGATYVAGPGASGLGGANNGGGGLGGGGAVFVQAGGSLTIQDGQISGGSVAGGAGGSGAGLSTVPAGNGQGFGSGIFLQGDQTLAFSATGGQTTVVSDVIADQTGSGGTGGNAGAGNLIIFGAGTVVLAASSTYTGGTSITSGGGTLELAAINAAGNPASHGGGISFIGSGAATLQIDQAALSGSGTFANPVSGFSGGHVIDLAGLAYDPNATATITGSTLAVSSGGVTDQLTLGDVNDATPQYLTAASDGHGGTLVSPTPAAPPTPPGTDTIVLDVSEDAYQGDAQYTVSVDGTTIGGTRTATASHAAGATQAVDIPGNFGPGPHTIGVTFLNDAYGGSPDTDRNLYVGSVSYDGQATTPPSAALYAAGTASFSTQPASAPTNLTLLLAEDAYGGDAQYSVAIDGQQVGAPGTVTASNAAGQTQAVDISQVLTPGVHDLAVSFLNDAYGGSPSADRNLYLAGVQENGTSLPGASYSFYGSGTDHISFTVAQA